MANMAAQALKSISIRTFAQLRVKRIGSVRSQPSIRGAHQFLLQRHGFTTDTAATQPSDPALKLSETCVNKIGEICKDNTYLRVQVDGGGCSGFQYKFELVAELNDDDIRFGPDGRVVIDSISLDYCAGSTLDYQVELIKSGFRMTSNPKAEQGCSCGASFALKM